MKPARYIKHKVSKSKILEKLRESILSEQTESKGIEKLVEKGIGELAENVKNPDEAAELIKKMDKMIKIKKNNIFMIACRQGKIVTRFKTNNKFISAVSAFEISKTTINFKIGIVKVIDEYSKMQKSCISLSYLKNNFSVIKGVCQEHASDFNNIPLVNRFDYSKVKKKSCLVHCKTKV